MKRQSIQAGLIILGVLVSLGLFPIPSAARTPSKEMLQAQALVSAVNNRRAASGLPAYNVNYALMAAAQAHSDYQASIGTVTHSGAGGSRPNDRARAAGYGGGAQVFVTENIYGGMNASAEAAVDWWIADGGWHYEGVMSTTYQDIGAGVASSGGTTYFTLDAGWILSNSTADSSSSSGGSTTAANATKAAAFKPLVVATAAADGSIIHVVEQGQTLWTIAAKYSISLDELLALNNMTQNSFVYPGNKIIVHPSNTPGAPPTSAPAAGEAAAGAPAAGQENSPAPMTETPTPLAAIDVLSTPISLTALPENQPETSGIASWRGIAALIIGVAALGAVLVLSFFKKEDEE